ncbi:bifunctional 2',3'-cyclic-nucleotide 2'-phosphodiesterase/3'-nucleotidase [Paraferrimonas sedimenticola]|uniref:2',3'-cyclic-nucleotide 2'-phosphodiesterase n=1 Tax=Paraferrimonas sedimenticola TaxID=375674 RepID=A0AA37RY66_9GAMM|nr:bifunctional 2',3'-cyclic-nucleotide 2'-phosphodiesterase/3'-nucleotidase [Paraferrimonas sedimenticola]GLP97410.1 2',3'-cyclic-nucleotide 2'-phosphodiesterase [Paraferrimonas sedimenticola]
MKPLLILLACISVVACQPTPTDPRIDATIQLRLLETSDLHANLMDYNYYQDRDDPSIGLARVASLIAQQRTPNSLLIDNGDLIQGSPMGDYMASLPLLDWNKHPAYKAMNELKYDVGNVGNHEFNYGLTFLFKALAGADFPYINANVVAADDASQHQFRPRVLLERTFTDTNGQPHQLNVGFIGLVPPQIMVWDKSHLTGEVQALDMVESARTQISELRKEGADLIVVIAHTGLGDPADLTSPNQEDVALALSKLDGVDALLLGHSHSVFPSSEFAGIEGVDIDTGRLNGVAAVMPGRWGDHLGQIDLTLNYSATQGWQVSASQTQSLPIFADGESKVAASADMHRVLHDDHHATLAFMQQPIGVASQPLNSYLSLLQDDPSVQIVADAQLAYVRKNLPNDLVDLPMVSVASPLKSGGRHATPNDNEQYVQVGAGELSYRNGADLYLYANTLVALKATGAQLKEWLECSANQFNQIDTGSTEAQSLINWRGHRTYNFDVIEGLHYQIDVTQPSRYNGDCRIVNDAAERIVGLEYQADNGDVLKGDAFEQQEFVVVTNNFRAFGNKFAGATAEQVVFESGYETRQLLIDFIRERSRYNPASGSFDSWVEVRPDMNWSLKPIANGSDLDIRFVTQESAAAQNYIDNFSHWPMDKVGQDELGFAEYRLDLSKQ